MDTLEKRMGAAVRAARQALGLTGAALASQVEVSAGTLSKIEAGDLWPKARTVEALKTTLRISWGTLFGAAEEDLGLPGAIHSGAVEVIKRIEAENASHRRKIQHLRAELERAQGQIDALERQLGQAHRLWLEANRVAVAFAGIYHVFRDQLAPEAMSKVKALYLELAASPETAAARLGATVKDEKE